MRSKIISEFFNETKKIMENNLYSIVVYGDPKGEDIDICVIPLVVEETDMKKLKELKRSLQDKYRKKLDLLYLPPDVFLEALSRMVSKLGQDVVWKQVKIWYDSSNFHQLILNSIKNPINKPPIEINDYKI